MCIDASCSPSTSTGETRAMNSARMPPHQDASRQPLAARAPPSRRDVRQRAT